MQLVKNSVLQLLPCRRCSLDWFPWPFLSPFIRFFLTLTSQLKPCGYFTYLIMMLHVSSSPNLYTTALTVLRNDLHDLRLKCKLAFPSFGRRCWGWVYKNQKSKWIPNGWALRLLYLLDNGTRVTCRSHATSTTLHWQFYVRFLVTLNQIQRKWYWPIILLKYTENGFKSPIICLIVDWAIVTNSNLASMWKFQAISF